MGTKSKRIPDTLTKGTLVRFNLPEGKWVMLHADYLIEICENEKADLYEITAKELEPIVRNHLNGLILARRNTQIDLTKTWFMILDPRIVRLRNAQPEFECLQLINVLWGDRRAFMCYFVEDDHQTEEGLLTIYGNEKT